MPLRNRVSRRAAPPWHTSIIKLCDRVYKYLRKALPTAVLWSYIDGRRRGRNSMPISAAFVLASILAWAVAVAASYHIR